MPPATGINYNFFPCCVHLSIFDQEEEFRLVDYVLSSAMDSGCYFDYRYFLCASDGCLCLGEWDLCLSLGFQWII
jgi:hypothetical protein